MRPLRLRAKNLRTWEELELELPAGITAIVGPNGAGKSTLVSAIDLALFGDGRELKRALTRGAADDEVAIELELEHAGETYRVRRGYVARGRGKPTLDLETIYRPRFDGVEREVLLDARTWEPLTRDTIAETQAELEGLLGLSRQTFRASSYLAQGEGDAFTAADPRERKAILLDALGVKRWDRLREVVHKLRTGAEDEAGKVEASIATLQRERLELGTAVDDLATAKGQAVAMREEVAGAERRVRVARVELEDGQSQEAELNARRERWQNAKAALADAQRRLGELDLPDLGIAPPEAGDDEAFVTTLKARAKRVPLLEQLLDLDREANAAAQNAASHDETLKAERRAMAELGRQQDELVEELADVDEELRNLVTCPTCERELDEAAKEAAGRALRARRTTLEARQGDVTTKAKRATERLLELEKNADLADEAKAAALKKIAALPLDDESRTRPELALAEGRQAERALEKIEATAGLRDRLKGEHAAAAMNEERALASVTELTGPPVADLRAKLAAAERSLESGRGVLTTLEGARVRAEARVERVNALDSRLADNAEELKTYQDGAELYRLAERAYGRDGIPALILETSAVPAIEAEANRIVAELGRDYRFELRTQRETNAGTVKEVLDVVVFTDSGEAAYEDFSGGERARLDVALRIALARLLASRRGADCRLLAIDEPAFLDDEGFELLAGVLRELVGEFETILVVSHVEALRDAFDSAIIVGGGADSSEPSRLEEVRGT